MKAINIVSPLAALLALAFIIPALINLSWFHASEDNGAHFLEPEVPAAHTYVAAENEPGSLSTGIDKTASPQIPSSMKASAENTVVSSIGEDERDSGGAVEMEEETQPDTVQEPVTDTNTDASREMIPDTVQTTTRKILTEAPGEVENGQVIGAVRVPSVSLSDTLAAGTSLDGAQKVLETGAALMCYDYMGLPEQAMVSVVGGHNYMEFNKLKDAKIGDDVLLELDWGIFEYTVYDIRIQAVLTSAPRGSLVLYTCHPFDEQYKPTGNAYFLCEPRAVSGELAG